MERLTRRNLSGNAIPVGLSAQIGRDILEHLAAYEDLADGVGGYDALSALLQAQREGRVVVYSAAPGQVVYAVEKHYDEDDGEAYWDVRGRCFKTWDEDKIGKTLFLTRDEAEIDAAVKEDTPCE